MSIVPTLPPASVEGYSRLSGQVPAGFWHRFFAFLIDGIVVSILDFGMAEFFQGFFARFPFWGTLLGFLVTTAYFAAFGSKLVDGQTLGMMATSVRVVTADGSTLSLKRSFLRYSVLLAPFLLTSTILPAGTPWLIAYGYEMGMTFAGFAVGYLAVFNRRTGQSLHDLVTDTFVVDASGAGPVRSDPFWDPHWAILVGLLIFGLNVAVILPHTSSVFGEVTTVESSVSRVPGLAASKVEIKFSGNQSGIIVTAGCDQISENHNKGAAKIAAAVLNGDPEAPERNYIQINCVKTVQVGFFKSTTNDYFVHTPQEWRTLIQN